MPRLPISPDPVAARQILDEIWSEIVNEQESPTDDNFEQLINSSLVAVRYALPSQILGKVTDAKLDCLCLQKKGGEGDAFWDPRSFAKKVVAPWVLENQKVLGSSVEPYVGNPLRVPRLQSDPGPVRGRADWILLYKVLNDVQERDNPSFTLSSLKLALRSIKKKLADNTFEFVVPGRTSLKQTRTIVSQFLSEGSGGDRGLSVAAALFTTLGKFFRLYTDVTRYAINASDASTGATGDIECSDEDGNIKLVVEVKERSLTLTDVKAGLIKARQKSLHELLFNAPDIKTDEAEEIASFVEKNWASGTNLYRLSIDELIAVGLMLTGEAGRKNFLENVGEQLNAYNTQPINRLRWKELLDEI